MPQKKVRRGSKIIANGGGHELKAKFVREIARTMKAQGLTQTAAASIFGATQPDVSKMLKGHFRQFSVERLMRFLVLLGRDIKITVVPTKGAPQITVSGVAR